MTLMFSYCLNPQIIREFAKYKFVSRIFRFMHTVKFIGILFHFLIKKTCQQIEKIDPKLLTQYFCFQSFQICFMYFLYLVIFTVVCQLINFLFNFFYYNLLLAIQYLCHFLSWFLLCLIFLLQKCFIRNFYS